MSSVSSFVCLSSNVSDISQSDFSFVENPTDKPLQFDASAIDIDENENINSIDDFEHLIITPGNIDNNSKPLLQTEQDAEWSSVNDHNFDIRSMDTISSIQSVDTVKNFIFGDYQFKTSPNKNGEAPSQWVWFGRKRKVKHRRKKNRLQSLCIIDENGEMEPETGAETTESKTVINVKDLNNFINNTIRINDDISRIIFLCNNICKTGVLKVNNMEIELHKIPLIGLKLRDIFFRKLVLLNEKHGDDFEEFDGEKYLLRREYWLKLSWNSRVFLVPFGSFEEFRNLYNVHNSVSSSEFLSVIDNESFNVLMKPEWIRVCLFRSYVMKINNMNMVKRMEIEREKMEEIRTMLHIGNFNHELVNIRRFKHKQLSFIMSDNYSRNDTEFNDSFKAFDALERDIEMKLRLESEVMERFTNSTYGC